MNQWYVYDFITRRWSSNQDQSGDFTVKQGATTIHEDSTVYTVSSSSWTMEVAAVTRWIASNGEHATILTNLSACYEKWKMGWEVHNGMCQCSTSTFEYRWHVSMFNIHLWIQMACVNVQHPPLNTDGMCQCSTSTFEHRCGSAVPDMPGSKDMTEQRDWYAKATVTSGLRLGRSDMLRAKGQWHDTIDHLEERGVERESARPSSLKGRGRVIVSQTNIETVSKAKLGNLLWDDMKRKWAFPSAQILS